MITSTDRGLFELHALLDGTEPCATNSNPDLFWFSDPGDDDARVFARLSCRDCHVRTECAAYAIAHPDVVGVWGGTTEAHRDALRATFGRDAGRRVS